MAHSNEKNPNQGQIMLGSVASSITDSVVLHLSHKTNLNAIWLADQVGIVANNTDYAVVQVKVGSTVVASYDTRAAGEGALAANVAKKMTIVAGQNLQAQDSDLLVNVTLHGAAVFTRGMMCLDFYPV